MSTATSPHPPASAPAGGTPSRWRSARLTRRVLVANLVAQVLIVGTGGAVRLTGSGLGCSTWPQCEPGSFTPQLHEALSIHPYVEFGNRLLTVILTVVAVAVAVRAGLDTRRRPSYRLLGFVPILGVLAQAVIGGLSVLGDLHPALVGSHMLASMLLVAVSTVLLERFSAGDGPARVAVSSTVLWLGRALAASAVVVLALGVVVTGAGPHSGDADVGYRFAVDPYVVARLHAASVWLFAALGAAMLLLTRRGPARVHRRLWLLAAVTVAQGAVGYVQFFTGLPEVLVGLHMVGAALLAAATAHVYVALHDRTPTDVSALGESPSLDVGGRA